MSSPLVVSIARTIPQVEEPLGYTDLVFMTFKEAYEELRRLAPIGDLHLHLSIEYVPSDDEWVG